jgi:predicted nuclease with TOPRIM domain
MNKNLKQSHGKEIYNRQNQTNEELSELSHKVDSNHRELKCEIRVINTRLDNIENKVDRLEERFDVLEERFDVLEERFDGLEQRFDAMDNRMCSLETGLVQTNNKLDVLIDHLIKTPKDK